MVKYDTTLKDATKLQHFNETKTGIISCSFFKIIFKNSFLFQKYFQELFLTHYLGVLRRTSLFVSYI